MAIYYMNVKVIGRSTGRTATGAAAYRSGERIVDERTGLVFDYTRRTGEIECETLAPLGAPEWVQDRSELWNRVEQGERRADAQVAREIVVAFPKELTPGEQRELIRGYVQEQFVSQGMVADVAIHRNPGNPHAHIMLTMREIGPEGFSSKKNREWNRPEMLDRWREEWANHANRALARADREERIDHRSLAEQGVDRLPHVHLGPNAAALERRGIQTDKGDHNRQVSEHNATVIDLQQAREEKRLLVAEKAVMERYSVRLQAGWPIPQAQALGQLEYRLGGAPLTWDQTAEMQKQQERELMGAKLELSGINKEGKRLERAEEALQCKREAEEHLAKLRAPIPTLKRFFSRDAREEYRQTELKMQHWENAALQAGVGSEADFREQRARWQRDQAKVPGLEEKIEGIGRTLERISRALDGFRLEQDREQQARWERINQRGRGGIDRDR